MLHIFRRDPSMSHDLVKMADDEATTTKVFGLLNGIAKRDYLGVGDITDEFMKEELFADLSQEEFTALVTKCKNLIKVSFLCSPTHSDQRWRLQEFIIIYKKF